MYSRVVKEKVTIMAGFPCAVMFICLAILVNFHVANCQDEAAGGQIPGQGEGQAMADEGPTLIPIDDNNVSEQPIYDGIDPESCLGKCQQKCQELPMQCEYIDDTLPVNCEMKSGECLDSCDDICQCVDECKEGCDNCEGCMDKCFRENGFEPDIGGQEVSTSLSPEENTPESA